MSTLHASTLEDRFWRKVAGGSHEDCWTWTAALSDNGYGRFRTPGRTVFAHRWAYEHMVGPIPDGLQIDHLCRNRTCVNPWHLEPVTGRVNTMRSPVAIAAKNAAKTHCPSGHRYDAANTRRHRGQRTCAACTARYGSSRSSA